MVLPKSHASFLGGLRPSYTGLTLVIPHGTGIPAIPHGSSSSQHRRTLELVLQKSHVYFRITFRPPGTASLGDSSGYPMRLTLVILHGTGIAAIPHVPLGPLGPSSSQHRRTLELVLQESHVYFRITFRPPGAASLGDSGYPTQD
jgi:hypothetical protein